MYLVQGTEGRGHGWDPQDSEAESSFPSVCLCHLSTEIGPQGQTEPVASQWGACRPPQGPWSGLRKVSRCRLVSCLPQAAQVKTEDAPRLSFSSLLTF